MTLNKIKFINQRDIYLTTIGKLNVQIILLARIDENSQHFFRDAVIDRNHSRHFILGVCIVFQMHYGVKVIWQSLCDSIGYNPELWIVSYMLKDEGLYITFMGFPFIFLHAQWIILFWKHIKKLTLNYICKLVYALVLSYSVQHELYYSYKANVWIGV